MRPSDYVPDARPKPRPWRSSSSSPATRSRGPRGRLARLEGTGYESFPVSSGALAGGVKLPAAELERLDRHERRLFMAAGGSDRTDLRSQDG